MNSIKRKFRELFVFLFWIYIYGTSFITTIFIIILFSTIYINTQPEEITMPNGFKYVKASGIHGATFIADKKGNLVVHGRIGKFKWSGDIVYGKRYGMGFLEEYYFVCKYNEDCTKNQHLNEEEFYKLSKKYNLPDLL